MHKVSENFVWFSNKKTELSTESNIVGQLRSIDGFHKVELNCKTDSFRKLSDKTKDIALKNTIPHFKKKTNSLIDYDDNCFYLWICRIKILLIDSCNLLTYL